LEKLAPQKRLGQHFLHDATYQRRIAERVAPLPGEWVLEIGPGEGALTQHLACLPTPLRVVEVDPRAALLIAQRFQGVEVLQQDVLALTPPPGPAVLVGNLPYNISSPIFFWLLQHRQVFRQATVMVQHEVAERIASPPGSRSYGILSVLLGAYFHTEYAFRVPPGAFRPPPKVQSGVLVLTRKPTEQHPDVGFEALRTVVKAAFGQRRKTLHNALKTIGLAPPAQLASLRAEVLPLGAFVALAQQWQAKIGEGPVGGG
jgi:16S rRNA (adenine1518-N6/adenine1519-N6)-dimethyltransferase